MLNDSGKVAFRAVVSGPGVDESNDEGIWSGTVNDLKLVARAGSHAPGTPVGVNFETFFPWNGALQLNARGQSVFTAFLMGDDVIFGQNSIGIWATDITGALHIIARTGDLLEVLPGDVRTILDLSFVNDGTGNSDGRASGINDRGQIVFWAKLAGGDEGIFVSNLVAVPEPGSLMLVAMCAATLSMRRMRRITVPLTLCFAVSLIAKSTDCLACELVEGCQYLMKACRKCLAVSYAVCYNRRHSELGSSSSSSLLRDVGQRTFRSPISRLT